MTDHSSPPSPFGPLVLPDGVEFRVWAPKHDHMRLRLGEAESIAMKRMAQGWHSVFVRDASPGALYSYVLPNQRSAPDPASRFQPHDVHGPSEVIDSTSFVWSDAGWRGRPWEECVLYELHIGAFTPEGTFLAAIEKLDALVDLGVTAIEIMPVADFPGHRGWGYDGVFLFAPESTYGRPDDFKALVNAANLRGLTVLLDVVYNHFGPSGNYFPNFAPIFTDQHETPWGAAVNYDAEESHFVREFIIQNALYWINEFHLGGLRLDAVHSIKDLSDEHILDEIARRVHASAGDRHIHLILENEDNEASRLTRDATGAPAFYTAQWNDDIHHAFHTAATGERAGYYAEYAGDARKLARALAEGFVFQGETMQFSGKARGEPSAGLPPTAFVAFIQNHDQVGNRAFGERLSAIAERPAQRALAALYLLGPQIPMLFMGEEWAADQPFPYFCDVGDELADAVRNGRRAEFASFAEFKDPDQLQRIPDPTAPETFLSAKLNWNEATQGAHAEHRALYRALMALRRAEIAPRLIGVGAHAGQARVIGGHAVEATWRMGDGATLAVRANLSEWSVRDLPSMQGRILWTEGEANATSLGAWSVLWTLATPR